MRRSAHPAEVGWALFIEEPKHGAIAGKNLGQ
jgi:hypothetical protein